MTHLPTLTELWAMMRRTLSNPRDGAAEVLSLAPGRDVLWLLFALVIVVTMMLGDLAALISQPPEDAISVSSLVFGVIQAGLFLVIAIAVASVGRAFGGQGDFDGALLLVIWLQSIFIVVQAIQVALMVIMPPLSAIVFMIGMALFFWLLVNFIAELHGFTSLGRVFLGVLFCTLAMGFVLSLLANAFGLTMVTTL